MKDIDIDNDPLPQSISKLNMNIQYLDLPTV